MLQYLLNNIGILYRCNDPDRPTTLLAFLNLDGEHPLEPLRPRHRVSLWFRVLLFFYGFLRNNVFTQFAFGREHTMKPREVDPWSGHQRCQAPHEFHRTEYHMSGAIIVRRLQGDDDITVIGKGKALLRNRGPGNVAAQALKLLTLMRLAGNTSM